jgi:hypothetical protein
LAIQGRITEARAELANVKPPAPDSLEQIVNLATKGLIEMRSGNLVGGAELYHRSIDLAAAVRNAALWCRASAHFTYECARYDKGVLPEATVAIMKIYNGLSEQARFSNSVLKPLGARGSSSLALHRGHGAPAPPQSQARSPWKSRSGWSSHTQPQSSQTAHFIDSSQASVAPNDDLCAKDQTPERGRGSMLA